MEVHLVSGNEPSLREEVAAAAPVVSIIIPARDAAATLGPQLEAVCRQDCHLDYEVVVVDNGSNDGTGRLVERMATEFPRLRLVAGPSAPNRSAARNLGAQHAQGTVLAFCDADDLVQPDWLSRLLEGMQHSEVVTGSLVRAAHIGDVDPSIGRKRRTEFRGLECLSSGNFAIRRDTFLAVGGFSEEFLHRVDIELACRLAIEGIEVAYAPDAVVVYRRRPDRRNELRQHFSWAVADVQLQKLYGSELRFRYSWKNSIKHWVLVGPSLLRAAVRREDLGPELTTLATLLGRLAGSMRYRKWAI